MEDGLEKRLLRNLLQTHSSRLDGRWSVPKDKTRFRDQTLSSFDAILLNGPELFSLNVNELRSPYDDRLVTEFDYSFVFGEGTCTKSWSTVNVAFCFSSEGKSLGAILPNFN